MLFPLNFAYFVESVDKVAPKLHKRWVDCCCLLTPSLPVSIILFHKTSVSSTRGREGGKIVVSGDFWVFQYFEDRNSVLILFIALQDPPPINESEHRALDTGISTWPLLMPWETAMA